MCLHAVIFQVRLRIYMCRSFCVLASDMRSSFQLFSGSGGFEDTSLKDF